MSNIVVRERAYVTPPPFGFFNFGVGTENRFRVENLKINDEIEKLKIGSADRFQLQQYSIYGTFV